MSDAKLNLKKKISDTLTYLQTSFKILLNFTQLPTEQQSAWKTTETSSYLNWGEKTYHTMEMSWNNLACITKPFDSIKSSSYENRQLLLTTFWEEAKEKNQS